MSIQSEIERITANITNAYSILSAKGATMPDARNTANLAAAIESIQRGEAMSIETIREICGYVWQGYLPKGYTLLEYIQSSGTQYIDTDFKPNNNTRVCLRVVQTDSPTGTVWLFGGRTSSTSATMGVLWYGGGSNWRADYNGSSQRASFPTSIGSSALLEVDYNKNVLTINGETKTFTAETFQSEGSLALLSMKTKNTIATAKMSAKLYACQIYDNGTLVRQYVPCINPDGEVGLYDLVGAKFYGNAGTGVFTAGWSLVEAEYIESSGTQYIDTGFKANQDTRVVMDAQLLTAPTNDHAVLFGSRNANTKQFWLYYRYNESKFAFRYGNLSTNYVVASDILARHTFDANKNVLTVENESVSAPVETFATDCNAYLFAVNNSGGTQKYESSLRFYSCQIYDNGTLVRDYIPYLRSDGIYGLYDKVNNKFYTNAGTGSFIGG